MEIRIHTFYRMHHSSNIYFKLGVLGVCFQCFVRQMAPRPPGGRMLWGSRYMSLTGRFNAPYSLTSPFPPRPPTYIIKHVSQVAHAYHVTVTAQRAACSQPASRLVWAYCLQSHRPTYCLRSLTAAKVSAYMRAFLEKCHYFRNDDPYGHKTQHVSCTWSARVCVQNFAIVRRGV